MNNAQADSQNQRRLLLTVSRALATVRTRDDLFGVMADELKPLIGYEDSGLALFTDDGLFAWSLLPILNASRQQHRYYDQLFRRLTPIPALYQVVQQTVSTRLRIWREADLTALTTCKLASFVLETGLRTVVVYKLICAGRTLGVWTLYYVDDAQVDDAVLPLVEGIAQQLATTVANVLANEAISTHEHEKSVGMAVGRALMIHADWSSMTAALARELHEWQTFDVFGILLDSTEPEQAHEIRLQPDGSWAYQNSPVIPKWEGLNLDQFADLQATFGEPAVWVGDQYAQHCRENSFSDAVREAYGLRSVMYLPLPFKRRGKARLFFGSRAGYALTETNLDLLIGLGPQIALGLENCLMVDEVARMKRHLDQNEMALRQEIDRIRSIVDQSPLLLTLLKQFMPDTTTVSAETPEQTPLITLRDVERSTIIDTLRLTNGRIRGEGGTAQRLAIEPNTLDARMHKLGIIKGDYAAKSKPFVGG